MISRAQLSPKFLPVAEGSPVQWQVEPGLTDYAAALELMESRATAIRDEGVPELVWLVEHTPLYTAGSSASAGDLIDAD